jgi:hypothetical protein
MASKKPEAPQDEGGLMYQNLRKLIAIVVRLNLSV